MSDPTRYLIWVEFEGPELNLMELAPDDELRPEWLRYELAENSLDFILGIEGIDEEDRMKWLLQEGIAPGQPFLLEVIQPTYSYGYYGDCDVEYDYDIVKVQPWTPEAVARAFERVLRQWRSAVLRNEIDQLKSKLKWSTSAIRIRRNIFNDRKTVHRTVTVSCGNDHLFEIRSAGPSHGHEQVATWDQLREQAQLRARSLIPDLDLKKFKEAFDGSPIF